MLPHIHGTPSASRKRLLISGGVLAVAICRLLPFELSAEDAKPGIRFRQAIRQQQNEARTATTKPNRPSEGQPSNSAKTNEAPQPMRSEPITSANSVAVEVDRMIEAELLASKITAAPICNDEDFLRRASFDIAGTIPTAREVTLFGLDPDADKRAKLVERLLMTDGYATNWARYWRDVFFMRATNERSRVMVGSFEEWIEKQLRDNVHWDAIATSLITALGEIQEHGETALMFIHEGNQEEIAGEVSRVFLGIQMQCANCHDHPTDKWTRDQFHSLAAFFPRVSIRREPNSIRDATIVSFDGNSRRPSPESFVENADNIVRFADRNRDGKVSKKESEGTMLERIFDRLIQAGDADKDGQLSVKEIKAMPLPPQQGRGTAEHHMPDLQHPNEKGKLMTPAFFVTGAKARTGMDDADRRGVLAKWVTAPTNPWFAKSFVNRMWGELLGEGFYMPIDDMGPERKARMGAALDLLATEFVKHDHDIKWLLGTITATRAYQRQVRYNEPTENPIPFASMIPSRLRSDQLFNAVVKVLGVDEGPRGIDGAMARFRQTPRQQVERLFGFDPSTPQDELLGNVPQALMLMNHPAVNAALRADGNTRLGQILANNRDDEDAVSELYLAFLARDPSDSELKTATDYLAQVGNRREAFEDLAWTLLNSSEFLSKR